MIAAAAIAIEKERARMMGWPSRIPTATDVAYAKAALEAVGPAQETIKDVADELHREAEVIRQALPEGRKDEVRFLHRLATRLERVATP